MQTAMDRNCNGWHERLFAFCVVCCFCCVASVVKSVVSVCYFTCFSPKDDIAQFELCFTYYWLACSSLAVISHLSYSSRSTINIHYNSICIHIFEKKAGIIRHALLKRNGTVNEKKTHCNARGATYQALRTQAWQIPIKGMHKSIANCKSQVIYSRKKANKWLLSLADLLPTKEHSKSRSLQKPS